MSQVRREDRDGVAVLHLDRPPVNAMDRGLLEDVVGEVERIAAQPPSALVVAGRQGAFSAGADLKAVPAYGPDDQRAMVGLINAMALGVYALPCPVVAAVTGHAIAGGMVLALCADRRIAARDGRYGLTEVRVGVPYPQAALGVVREELGGRVARVMALGAALVDAQECLRLGAFDEVVEPDAVLPRALTVAAELADLPGDVYARTKRDLRGTTVDRLRAAAADDPLLARWVDAG
jgi:enoyl-CoA hydratase/carnithine racemase